ncbi:MAG: methylmalonyl-CoA epimerase [Deltaproteobacteria bacterium]|nr:methylmalonyl-CoA epimerase [Deltaproteobacteria bacterium]
MIQKIAHIGVTVKNVEEAEKFYSEVLNLPVRGREESKEIKVAFIPVGDTAIELLQGMTPDAPIARFIEKKGEGVHHIAYQVDNIEKALEELKAKGVALIDEKPRRGAHNSKIAFLHPKNTYGVLIELVEPDKNH